MINSVWKAVIENSELSTNLIIFLVVCFGIATDFFATREDLKDIRNKLTNIDAKVTKIKTSNALSEHDINSIKSNVKENDKVLDTLKDETNKLVNRYGQIKVKIGNINSEQEKIESDIETYHD
jgi:chromosome segregation ATPase